MEVDIQIETRGLDSELTETSAYQDVEKEPESLLFSLCKAIDSSDYREVMRILIQDFDINQQDYDGRTALHIACQKNDYEITKLILLSGADPRIKDRWNSYPINDSVNPTIHNLLKSYGSPEPNSNKIFDFLNMVANNDEIYVKKMLDSGIDVNVKDYDNRTALHIASDKNLYSMVKLLLKYNPDVGLKDNWNNTAMEICLQNKNPKIYYLLNSKVSKYSSLYGLEWESNGLTKDDENYNNYGSLNFIESGKNVDNQDSEIIFRSCHEKNYEEVENLLKKGVDVNIVDYDSRSLLHIAVSNSDVKMVNLLLDYKINFNLRDKNNKTPLYEASLLPDLSIHSILYKAGAVNCCGIQGPVNCMYAAEGNLLEIQKLYVNNISLELADYDQRTALHLACSKGYLELVKWLLKVAMVNPAPVDAWKNTPLDEAIKNKHKKIVRFFREFQKSG